MDNVLAKDLMTEAELSQYETLEKLYNSLYVASPNLEDSILGQANELSQVIHSQMATIRDNVLRRKPIVKNILNHLYYTDNSFKTVFTGWAYGEDNCFYPDNGTYDYICYFKNGKMMTNNVPRNVKEYVTDDNWYILPDKTMSEKSGVMFNLGGVIPLAFMTGVDFPFELKGDVAEEISKRLERAAKKGITAYKMK